jgi:hypothetical protein
MAQLPMVVEQEVAAETLSEVVEAAGDNSQAVVVQTRYRVVAPITQEQLRLIILAPVGVVVAGEPQEVTAGLAAAPFQEQVVLAARQSI